MTCPPNVERRFTPSQLIAVSPFTSGISRQGADRIIRIAMRQVEEHDLSFASQDCEVWQVAYSLRNHMAQVARVVEKVCERLLLPEHDTVLAHMAASLHDLGKIDEVCRAYRRHKCLSKAERVQVGLHAELSAHRIFSLMRCVREEERAFLAEVVLVVRSHHKCYWLSNSRLRHIAYIIKVVDTWVSLQENRHLPGLSTEQANDRLHTIDFAQQEQDACHILHLNLIEEVKKAIISLYGLSHSMV